MRAETDQNDVSKKQKQKHDSARRGQTEGSELCLVDATVRVVFLCSSTYRGNALGNAGEPRSGELVHPEAAAQRESLAGGPPWRTAPHAQPADGRNASEIV